MGERDEEWVDYVKLKRAGLRGAYLCSSTGFSNNSKKKSICGRKAYIFSLTHPSLRFLITARLSFVVLLSVLFFHVSLRAVAEEGARLQQSHSKAHPKKKDISFVSTPCIRRNSSTYSPRRSGVLVVAKYREARADGVKRAYSSATPSLRMATTAAHASPPLVKNVVSSSQEENVVYSIGPYCTAGRLARLPVLLTAPVKNRSGAR